MKPRVDPHIVSFRKDVEWCRYAVRSLRKYATGFGAVTLVVPASDRAIFEGMADTLVNVAPAHDRLTRAHHSGDYIE